jgi:hypothetical protein
VRLVGLIGAVVAATVVMAGLGQARGTPSFAVASTAGTAAPSRSAAMAPLFRRSAVTACLRRGGVTVGPVRPANSRFRALRDLAQRTSLEARLRGDAVALAFGQTEADAELLVELLRVPRDPYRLVRRRNVVFLQRPGTGPARTAVAGCLR